MKRVGIIIFLFAICLLPSSCQDSLPNEESYKVLINEEVYSLIDAEGYEKFSMSEKQYDNHGIDDKKTENILDKSFSLEYLYSISSNINSENMDYYYCESLDCQFAYSSTTGKLLRIFSEKSSGVIIPTEVLVSGDNYFSWLKNIINMILDVNVEGYTLKCKTYFSDASFENSFVFSNKEKQVSFYSIEYAKYIGEYKSAEMVKVIAQPDGSIASIRHTDVQYDLFETTTIDEDRLYRTIESTVYDIYSSKYTIKNYKVNSMLWQLYKGKPYLLCGVEIRSIDASGEEIGCAVILAIAP